MAERRLSLPRRGRMDASVSERTGGVNACIERSPHPTSLGYRLRSATLPEDGGGMKRVCRARYGIERHHARPLASPRPLWNVAARKRGFDMNAPPVQTLKEQAF